MALTVIRDPVTGVSFTAVPGERAYLLTEDGALSFSFEFAPPEVEYGPLEQEWVQVDRVGLVPLLVRKADKLDTIKFTVNLANKDWYYGDQGGHLDALRNIAKSRQRVMMRYSEHEAGLWRITALTYSSVLRHPDTNRIIRATADLTLTRASEPSSDVGPVSTPAAPQPQPAAGSTTTVRTHTVTQGNTLWGIAQRYYGRGDRWPIIYDANRNKISQVTDLQIGTVLIIP